MDPATQAMADCMAMVRGEHAVPPLTSQDVARIESEWVASLPGPGYLVLSSLHVVRRLIDAGATGRAIEHLGNALRLIEHYRLGMTEWPDEGGVPAAPNPPEFEGIRAQPVAELVAAANAVVERWHSKDWKQPHTAEFIGRLAAAVGAVKFPRPELYTCIGKDGTYALVGGAKPAGELRDLVQGKGLTVYRDVLSQAVYVRIDSDFDQRMARIGND
jgi:hypothetical protein